MGRLRIQVVYVLGSDACAQTAVWSLSRKRASPFCQNLVHHFMEVALTWSAETGGERRRRHVLSSVTCGTWALRLPRQVSEFSLATGLHRVSLLLGAVSVSPTNPFLFFSQLLLGEEHVCFLLEHSAAEIRPLCVCPAATDPEHSL